MSIDIVDQPLAAARFQGGRVTATRPEQVVDEFEIHDGRIRKLEVTVTSMPPIPQGDEAP